MEHVIVNKEVIRRDSNVDLESIRQQMYIKQKAAAMRRTGIRLCANIFLVTIVLLPLLYAISVAFMPSGELFTTELNILPKHPTLANFKDAFAKVPLIRFVFD